MQFLLTAGLRAEKSGRATNMIYSQMVFALGAERVVWGTSPGIWSWGGTFLIMGAAGAVAVQKGGGAGAKTGEARPKVVAVGNLPKGVQVRDEEEAAGMLLHDAELHQLGDDDDDYDHDHKHEEDIEMMDRGRSTSVEDDDATVRASLEEDEAQSKQQDNEYLHPKARPGEWQFQHGRTTGAGEGETESEEVSPHSPSVSRKKPVFWGR